jgi:hypothetical protein
MESLVARVDALHRKLISVDIPISNPVVRALNDRISELAESIASFESRVLSGGRVRLEAVEKQLAELQSTVAKRMEYGNDALRAIEARLRTLEAAGVELKPAVHPPKEKSIDPGEGWRLLEPDDIVLAADEIMCGPGREWLPVEGSLGHTVRSLRSYAYRRRITQPKRVRYELVQEGDVILHGDEFWSTHKKAWRFVDGGIGLPAHPERNTTPIRRQIKD